MTTNVADDDAARLAALIGDSDSADSAAEDAEPSPRDTGRAPTPEPEADGEERAPSAFLFGELCRVRERANKSEVEAQALERKLSMAEELRSVDVARARAALEKRRDDLRNELAANAKLHDTFDAIQRACGSNVAQYTVSPMRRCLNSTLSESTWKTCTNSRPHASA